MIFLIAFYFMICKQKAVMLSRKLGCYFQRRVFLANEINIVKSRANIKNTDHSFIRFHTHFPLARVAGAAAIQEHRPSAENNTTVLKEIEVN